MLLVVANREPDGEARDAVVRQLLEAHRQLLTDLYGRRLERCGALLVRTPRAHAELLVCLGLADPDDASLLDSVALLEADNLVLVVHELLVFLEVGGAVPHLVEPCLVAQNEPLVAVGDVLSVEPLDVLQVVSDVGRQELESGEPVLLEEVGQVGIALLIRAVLDRVVDAEVNLLRLRLVGRLERLLLDEPYNLLERQAVAVELAVQNRALGEPVNLGADVVHVREGLARARVESLA